ncbi:MAG: DUF1667 domain-containing protein [Spirochaeta sp.]
MSRKRRMICISCPIGCRLTVSAEGDSLSVQGNQCRRGEIYANEEWFAPKRILTTTCRVQGSPLLVRVAVRTTAALPVEHINPLLQELHSMTLSAPLPIGSVVAENVKDTGIDVITSHSV